MEKIRQPIVTVAGHVDHGKTTILDSIRKTKIYETEAGGITQKISFTLFPKDKIKERCPLIEKNKINLEIPGFLFIDTPGHAAFQNLRKRGGSLADLAILVIDINEGIKPQTAEVIQILKANKTPFIIALNKIDNISGWRKQSENIVENISLQGLRVKEEFMERVMIIQGALHSYGFESMLFYQINDFTKNVALVPCSGKTGEGIQELIMTLCGLSQKYLKNRLALKEDGKGVILEVKKEKNIEYLEAILYDGILTAKDEIVIASFDEPIIGKIRVLEEVLPVSSKFKTVHRVHAASGIRMQLAESVKVLPGMPFQVFNGNIEEIKKEFKKQIGENIKVDEEGIIVKADSLGSLEALLVLLKEANIKVCKAGIGNIDKKDIIAANTNFEKNVLNAIVLGFNVTLDEEAKAIDKKNIKIIEGDVVYRLIEQLQLYREEKQKEIEKEKLMRLASVCKIKILPQYVFRNSNPAIFGIRVEAGKLKEGAMMINEEGEEVGEIKKIQMEKESLKEATSGMEVAVSISGVNFERQLKDKEFLYSDISAGMFKEFKKNKEILSREEIEVLQKIAEIKRKKEVTWGI